VSIGLTLSADEEASHLILDIIGYLIFGDLDFGLRFGLAKVQITKYQISDNQYPILNNPYPIYRLCRFLSIFTNDADRSSCSVSPDN
jgi:hypothetical protein